MDIILRRLFQFITSHPPSLSLGEDGSSSCKYNIYVYNEGMSNVAEQRICKIIIKKKPNHNKACYQIILAFAKREDTQPTTENIKETINDLLEREIIYNKNKDKK